MPVINNYTPKDYNNSSQVWGAIQDNNGIMYFGMTNGGGIGEYDGKEWRFIDIPNNTTVFSFAKDDKGIIYVGAINDFGYLKEDSLGKKEYISLRDLILDPNLKFRAIWNTKVVKNEVYFYSVNALFKYSITNHSIKIYHPETNSNFSGLFSFGDNVYVQQKNIGLMKIGRDSLELITDFYKNKSIRGAFQISKDSLLISTNTTGIFIYNPSNNISIPFYQEDIDQSEGNAIYTSQLLPNNLMAYSIFGRGVMISSLNGNKLQWLNVNNGLTTNSIYRIYPSTDGNLWLLTENGISKTDASFHLSLWDKRNGLDGSVSDILRFNERLYVSTFSGIYVLNNQNTFEKVSGIPNGQCWDLISFSVDNSNQILLAGTPRGIYEIMGSSSYLVRKGRYGLTMLQSNFDKNRLFVVDDPNLISMKYDNGKWIEEGMITGISENIRRIEEDESGNLWLGTYNAGILKVTLDFQNIIKPKEIEYFTEKDGLPNLISIMPQKLGNVILFTTENGIYSFNQRSSLFEPYSKLSSILVNEKFGTGILEELNDGSILFLPSSYKGSNPGIIKHNGSNLYEWIYQPFSMFDKIPFTSTYEDLDGVIWIGSTEGLFRYDKRMDNSNYNAEFTTLIRKVTLKDESIISYGGNLSNAALPYENNDITFSMAAPFFDEESKTVFSYLLEGYNKNWSKWSSSSSVSFTNLDEGTYTFKAKAKNIYNKESSVAEFYFTILPPWYRTWWAYLSYSFFIFGFITVFDKWNKKRLKKIHDREHEEEIERKQHVARMLIDKQEEERKRISREMHDSIGQELLILKHQLQLKLRDQSLDSETKSLLEEQSAAASNILTEVRNITHDLRPPELDRLGLTETIKSILNRIRNANEIKLIGEIDSVDDFFEKDNQINLVRIIQEAMNNVMKHAEATKVNVKLINENNRVSLTIIDNGKGIAIDQNGFSGLGMNDIKERVEFLGGNMKIISSKDNGTILEFNFTKKDSYAE